jgi:O-antigen/teichoic acid export membrane protein
MASLGKGALYFMAANIVFLTSGYLIHVGLARILGPASYGIFGVVVYLFTLGDMIVSSGTPAGASKYIAEDNRKAIAIKNKALKMQLLLGFSIFAIFFLFAGVLANILGDLSLTFYIRISALIILATALFSLYKGCLNGLREYGKQAIAYISWSGVKVGSVFLLVFLGFSIAGAIFGYFLASLVGFLLAWCFFSRVKGNKDDNDFETGKIVRFALPVIVFTVVFTFLMSIDLFFVKSLLEEDAKTGYYTAASMIARIPYSVLIGLSSALFPAISRSTFLSDHSLTGSYIKNSLRYLLMLLIPGILLIISTSGELVNLFYSSLYLPAASPLAILVIGLGFLTVFQILTTIITASGRPKISMSIVLLLVPIAISLNLFLIPIYELNGAAISIVITSLLGLILVSLYVWKYFKALVERRSFLRILLASMAIFYISLRLDFSGFFLILEYLGLFLLYLGILVLLREVDRRDLETLKGIVG